MRLKNLKNKDIILKKSIYLIRNIDKHMDYQKIFGNNNNIEIEIGCGKGNFIINKALENPNINYIGIEKYDSVLARALKKLENVELIPNLKFIRYDAKDIDELFINDISKLYLNFSDPWPKLKHHDRRLTSEIFLNKYEKIFKGNKIIIQKTDNKELYEFSLNNFQKCGYEIAATSEDLYNSKYVDGNIATEYETRFHNMGMPIYYIEAKKKTL